MQVDSGKTKKTNMSEKLIGLTSVLRWVMYISKKAARVIHTYGSKIKNSDHHNTEEGKRYIFMLLFEETATTIFGKNNLLKVEKWERKNRNNKFTLNTLNKNTVRRVITMATDRKEGKEEELVLTSYTCDTLFCSRKEGRQKKGGNHRGRKMKG